MILNPVLNVVIHQFRIGAIFVYRVSEKNINNGSVNDREENMREEDESNIRGGETDMDLYTPVDSLVICNQSHVCKNAQCSHRVPHNRNCANTAPCYDSEFEAGKIPDKSTVPISACVAISSDGYYHTGTREMCPHCQGGGYTHRTQRHKIPNR